MNRKRKIVESQKWTNNREISLKGTVSRPEAQNKPERKGKGLKRGKKSLHWDHVRAQIRIAFEKAGVTRCENCNSGFNLRFCHRLKRRFITTAEELSTVALLCETCDVELEYSGHENLYKGITAIIEKRQI